MCRVTAALLIGSVALGFVLPAQAFDRGGFRSGISKGAFRGGFSAVNRTGFPKFHGFRRHFGFGAPAILDDDGDSGVTVVLQQVFMAPPPSRSGFQPPSVLDLPVQLGIREAKPEQPAVYVLNEGESRSIYKGAVRVSAGPRIIDVTADGSPDPGPGFGAKIVHLAVPVGAGP